MTTALMYCQNEFNTAHDQTRKNKAIFEAFETLKKEIVLLDYIDQISLYSVTTQFLQSLLQTDDVINPLDVFVLNSNTIVDGKNPTLKTVALVLGILAISLAVVTLGLSIGFGVGLLLGLWQTPMLFMASMLAAEVTPVIVASISSATGIAAGLISRFLFFREPGIKGALNNCVEAVKQSHLEAKPESANDDTMVQDGEEEVQPQASVVL